MNLLFTAVLLFWSSRRVGSRLSPRPADRFWIGLATAILQLGTIASLTSVASALSPAAWATAQMVIALTILFLTGGWRSLKLPHLVHSWKRASPALRRVASSLSTWDWAMLTVCAAALGLSAVTQLATPIHGGDEMNYHASRVIYWIQHHSIFPFVTHNDRQTIVPFGSELLFLWPVLLTDAEWTGRFVFWLAYPGAAIGLYLLLRALEVSRSIRLAGVVILLETPLVTASAIGLKPELWSVVTLIGAAYWVVAICVDPERTMMKCALLGTFAMLGANMRAFPLALLPGVLLVATWAPGSTGRGQRLKALAGGLACGAILSGFIITVGFNLAWYGHPLGPKGARQIVSADLNPRQVYTHTVRFAFLLAELPDVAIPADVRARVGTVANQMITAVGAGRPLRFEDNGTPWPGRYTYALGEHSTRFSTWGWFWMPALGIALFQLVRTVRLTWPRVRLAPVAALALLAIPLLVVVVIIPRWMVDSDVPVRYLVGPFALALPMGVALWAGVFGTTRFAGSLSAMVLVWTIDQPIRLQLFDALKSMSTPVSAWHIDGPFEEALGAMPGGSRILFVGDESAPDYALFAPATRFANTVIPWGKTAFDRDRMRGLIASQHVTHVLVQDDTRVQFHWDPEVGTREMVAWLGREAGLRPIPLTTPHMRLFETSDSARTNDLAFQTLAVPASAPLITVGRMLQNDVGIEPTFLKTPWPVETPNAAEGGFLWIGQGQAEGVEFALWSRQDRAIDLQLTVSPGPSLMTPERSVGLLADGALVGEQTFKAHTVVTFHVLLHAGRNALQFFATDAATVRSMPNGDTRHLIVALHEAVVAGGSMSTGANGGQTASNDLAQSARRAAGLVASRQQTPGYWLTTYTSGVQFEQPGQEMNTFTPAMMIDLLAPVATEAGLQGSLQAARQFLTNQIEPGGLVRYHGRPDGPTIGALGCAITPDADDTALVWRIAPSKDTALWSTAVATMRRYLTPDGLYRTWLAPADRYQCINQGSDPDPADAVIQMHILMRLAETDPPAAAALCRALGRAIDQDRVWVYYRQAPLIPLLRRTDMRAAGCPLPRPPSRVSVAAAGQELWMAAAGLLTRVLGSGGPPPASTEVQDVLRQLARDDFASVQKTPPLLYHNDLTASGRRVYWSEEFGYALWLRLWFESGRHGLVPR